MPFRLVGYNKPVDTSSPEGTRQSILDLVQWTTYEFQGVSQALLSTEADKIWHAAPPKPRAGTQAYADGTNWNPGAGEGFYEYTSTGWVPMTTGSNALAPFMRSYLAGLTLSVVGTSSATFSVAPGVAANSTNVDMLTLGATMNKSTSAWAAGSGNGSLDTGTIGASSWYHVFIIKNPTTRVVDILTSLSATAPTLPSGFTLFRRIGSMKTTSSSLWTGFTQYGDNFYWGSVVIDLSNINIGTTLTGIVISVPPGTLVTSLLTIIFSSSVANTSFQVQSSITATYTSLLYAPTAGGFASVPGQILTSNGQVQGSCSSAATNGCYIYTLGWIDRRGRDS